MSIFEWTNLSRKLICEIGKLLYERSYVVSSDGNVSIRLDENTVLATPTMTCKGPDDGRFAWR